MPLKKSGHQTLINTQSFHNDNGERNGLLVITKTPQSRGVFFEQ